LHHEQIGHLPGVLLSPKLFAVVNFIEFDVNGQSVAALCDSARQYCLDAKCVADLLEIRSLPFVPGNRANLLLMLSVIPSEM
jgi:hypothetical protein